MKDFEIGRKGFIALSLSVQTAPGRNPFHYVPAFFFEMNETTARCIDLVTFVILAVRNRGSRSGEVAPSLKAMTAKIDAQFEQVSFGMTLERWTAPTTENYKHGAATVTICAKRVQQASSRVEARILP